MEAVNTFIFKCLGCSAQVERKTKFINRGGRYCSTCCYYNSKTKTKSRKCRNCGCTFSNNNPLRYCGPRCFAEFTRKRRTINCAACGESFEKKRPGVSQRYCSKKCAAKGETLPPQEFDCLKCGKHVVIRRVNSRLRKFCSNDCRCGYMQGEHHPLFRGNRRGYRGANWPSQAAQARKRDGLLCQGCRGPLTQKASVDHIVPFRLTALYGKREGKDPNDLANLVSLCRSCHAKKTQVERKLLRGDVVGFISGVKAIIPLERVNAALLFWGLS